MPQQSKLTLAKDSQGKWMVKNQQGNGPYQLKVEKSGTEENPQSVTLINDDGTGEPSYVVDP